MNLNVSSFPSMHFFLLYDFFPPLIFEKKKMLGEFFWNRRAEVRGQKQEHKVRRQSGSLKESSLPSLHFFFPVWFFFLLERKKMLGENVWNKRAKVGAKSERAKWELESKFLPFFWFFFLLFFYVFCLLYVWKEDVGNVSLFSSMVVL
jgi:hypothetical protein